MYRLCPLILLLFPAIIFAGNITGLVTDIANDSPLTGVNVIIKELQTGSITNEKGEFTLPDITQGEYTLIVSHLGYVSKQEPVVIGKDITHLNIPLKKKNFRLEEVVVSSNRYREISKVPSRINLIKAENIEHSADNNITDIIGSISGIDIENTLGVYSSRSTVSLRGLSGTDQSRTLILMDGIPLNKSDGGSVNWNMIHKENIELIHVVKGSGSAKYGSNAMGGVVNIISKKPYEKLSGFIKAGYGTYNTYSGSMGLNGLYEFENQNKLYWSVMGSALKSDGYITELTEYIEVDDSIIVPVFLEEVNANVKLGYSTNKHNIEVFTNYFDDIRGNGIFVFENYGACSEHDTWFSVLKYNYGYRNLNVNAKTFSSVENHARVYEYMKDAEYKLYDVDSKRSDRGGDIDISYTSTTNTLSTGVVYKQGSVDATDTYYTSTDLISNAGTMDIAAVYVQDEIDLQPINIQINMGLRFDYAQFRDALFAVDYPSYSIAFMSNYADTLLGNKSWSTVSPKFSIQKRFSEHSRIYFSYGKGFKAPLLDDLCRTSKKQGSFKIANPALKPETVHNLELGVDYPVSRFLNVKQSGYYIIGNDFMYLMSTGDSVNMGYKIAPIYAIANISAVNIYGLETELEYTINEAFSGYLNYTYNISQIKKHLVNTIGADINLTNKYLTNMPDHKISAGINWKNKIADISFSGKYIGTRWVNDVNEVDDEYLLTDKFPAYTLVNAKLQRELFDGLSVILSINNAFNKIYVNNRLQRCPGRTITGQVVYKF